jgi:hypothetical protein
MPKLNSVALRLPLVASPPSSSLSRSLTNSLSPSYTLLHPTHSYTHSLTHTLTHSYPPTRSYTLLHSHTYTHNPSLTHTLTACTRTRALGPGSHWVFATCPSLRDTSSNQRPRNLTRTIVSHQIPSLFLLSTPHCQAVAIHLRGRDRRVRLELK